MITTGDLRSDLARELKAEVEQFASEKKGLNEFYILVTCKSSGGELKTTLVLLSKKDGDKFKKQKALNSMLFHINKRQGKIDLVYCLPPDAPIDADVEMSGVASEIVTVSAQGMPILYDN